MKSLTGITFTAAAAAAAALLAAHPAAAQIGGTKSDAPIDITADELEVQQGQCVSVWKGSAEALQDTSRLRADVLRAYFVPKPKAAGAAATPGASNSACGELLRIEAEGSVYYVTPDQRVHSKAATYDANNSTVVMTGDVVAVHGQDVLRGDRMVFNNKTGEGHMQGGSKGGKDRPRGVFYPKQSTDDSSATKPAAPKAGDSR